MSALRDIFTEHFTVSKKMANPLGELLRAWAFPGDGYGCYSNFTLRSEFVETEATAREFSMLWGRRFDPNDSDENSWGYCDVEAIKEISWFKHPNGIEVGWHWDGDGCLAFYVPEQEPGHRVLATHDCKHDDEWKFEDDEAIFSSSAEGAAPL